MEGVWHNNNGPDGYPNVFNANRNGDDLWLNENDANPSNRWNADNRFLFRRKSLYFSAFSGVLFQIIFVVE